jgi:adenylate cyclase class IV
MAKFKEIEIKWDASSVKRSLFNKAVADFCKQKKLKNKLVQVAAFDYYHSSKDGHVARHRSGAGTNELTVKSRISKNSTTIRREINLKLAKETSPIEVQEAMEEWGFTDNLPIFKDCDIYFINDGKYVVDIVWYKVSSPRVVGPDKIFIEVEVHNAPEKSSMRILNNWKKFLYANFEITDKNIINESLYEIYSGKRYRMSRKK